MPVAHLFLVCPHTIIFIAAVLRISPFPWHLPGSLKLPTRRTRERTDRPWSRELSESTGTLSLCRQGGVVKHKARKWARRATEFLLPPYSKRFVGLECVLLLAGWKQNECKDMRSTTTILRFLLKFVLPWLTESSSVAASGGARTQGRFLFNSIIILDNRGK